jgi:hypothetical protein
LEEGLFGCRDCRCARGLLMRAFVVFAVVAALALAVKLAVAWA